ncbi:SDR family oxidoreductase [Streptomyces sp. TLI_185]|uniref:SDR family oxidoreductase n=1 Tax=Streptomyces sp. TLI_185 TaxID=2485151 RepID=UPI001C85FFA3|nr:SDR family oxidoreductase [Streptomyces sp. TLI_185]
MATALAVNAESRGLTVEEVEREFSAAISIGRIVTPDEVAAVIAFLAGPRSVALNGDPIIASGGELGPIYY